MTENPYKKTEPLSTSDEKTWVIVQYVGAFFVDFLSPLIAYFLFNNRGPFISSHTKEHLNFSLTVLGAYLVLAISLIGWLLIGVPFIVAIVFRIIAIVKASQGEEYRFPLTIRFIK